MTARVTLACNGLIPGGGYPCRQATPVGSPRDGAAARDIARRTHSWATGIDATGALVDLCPPCARNAAQHPERGVRLLLPGQRPPAPRRPAFGPPLAEAAAQAALRLAGGTQ